MTGSTSTPSKNNNFVVRKSGLHASIAEQTAMEMEAIVNQLKNNTKEDTVAPTPIKSNRSGDTAVAPSEEVMVSGDTERYGSGSTATTTDSNGSSSSRIPESTTAPPLRKSSSKRRKTRRRIIAAVIFPVFLAVGVAWYLNQDEAALQSLVDIFSNIRAGNTVVVQDLFQPQQQHQQQPVVHHQYHQRMKVERCRIINGESHCESREESQSGATTTTLPVSQTNDEGHHQQQIGSEYNRNQQQLYWQQQQQQQQQRQEEQEQQRRQLPGSGW